jgi:hypothetical protein
MVILELSYQQEEFHALTEDIWRVREENKRKLLQSESIKL